MDIALKQKISFAIRQYAQNRRAVLDTLSKESQEMLVKSVGDIIGNIDLRNYGQSFRLVDDQGVSKTPEEAKVIIAEAFFDLITTMPMGRIASYVNSHLTHGRKDFRLAVGVSKQWAGISLVPICRFDSVTEQSIEFEARIRAQDVYPQPPRASAQVSAKPVNKPDAAADVIVDGGHYDSTMFRASAAGYLMAHSICFIESKGFRSTNWMAGYNFQVRGVGGVDATQIRDMLERFTSITSQTDQSSHSSFRLTKRDDIQQLFNNLGIGEVFQGYYQQMLDFHQTHRGENFNPIKIDIDLQALLPSVREYICNNEFSIRNIIENNPNITAEEAKEELEAAFTLGVEGDLWQ